jgi:AAHS family 4-hydroxybenzoate transporter-like MFS transporter
MATESNIELRTVLDRSKMGALQIGAMVVCFIVVALDGFDTQSIAFVAPSLREAWDVSPEMFGPLFGAGLLGTLIGSVALGSVADRFGRKPMLILSTALFGIMTLACASAASIEQLGLYRFIAGLGLGGAIPNILALISEYAPKSIRSTAIVLTFAGFPIGAVLGGMGSARLIPAFGWESVFVVGGALPLIMLIFIAAFVPESARYLAARPARREKLNSILRRAEPSLDEQQLAAVSMPSENHSSVPVGDLFRHGRASWTVLLWCLTFTNLLLAYFLVNWIPLLLEGTGMDRHDAIMGVVVLNLGGVIGSFLIGRISDKKGPFVALATAYLLGAFCVAAVGLMIDSAVSTLMMLFFVVGFCVFGAQLNLSAISAIYYPIYMRSTGIGWNMGIGRFGSVVGPTVGGALIAIGFSQGEMFLSAAVPAVIAGIIVIAMRFNAPDVDHPEARAAGIGVKGEH